MLENREHGGFDPEKDGDPELIIAVANEVVTAINPIRKRSLRYRAFQDIKALQEAISTQNIGLADELRLDIETKSLRSTYREARQQMLDSLSPLRQVIAMHVESSKREIRFGEELKNLERNFINRRGRGRRKK